MQWKYLLRENPSTHLPRSHAFSCSQSVQWSSHYLAHICRLITTVIVRLFIQELSHIRFNQRRRTRCKAIGIDLGTYETTVSQKFQTRSCSRKNTVYCINSELPGSRNFVSEQFYPSDALQFRTNDSTSFLFIFPNQSDE